MVLSDLDLIAITLAIVAQMITSIALFISARRWEQRYHHAANILKTERIARDIRY
jgi:hypothetical protein